MKLQVVDHGGKTRPISSPVVLSVSAHLPRDSPLPVPPPSRQLGSQTVGWRALTRGECRFGSTGRRNSSRTIIRLDSFVPTTALRRLPITECAPCAISLQSDALKTPNRATPPPWQALAVRPFSGQYGISCGKPLPKLFARRVYSPTAWLGGAALAPRTPLLPSARPG